MRGFELSPAPVTHSSDLPRLARCVAAAHLGARGCCSVGAGSPGLIGWLCAEFSGSLASPPRAVLCPPSARQAGSLPLGSERAGGFGLRGGGGGGGGASERARGAGASGCESPVPGALATQSQRLTARARAERQRRRVRPAPGPAAPPYIPPDQFARA